MLTPRIGDARGRVNVWKVPQDQAHDVMIRCLSVWRQSYPNAFPPKDRPRRPLKRGIHRDLMGSDPSISEDDCRIALHRYTRSTTYLRCLAPDADRFDLAGDICGTVSSEEAVKAKTIVKTRSKRRRAAEKEKARAEREVKKSKPLGLAGLKAAAQQRRQVEGRV